MNSQITDVEDNREEISRMQRKAQEQRREFWGWVISLVAAVAIALALRFFVL